MTPPPAQCEHKFLSFANKADDSVPIGPMCQEAMQPAEAIQGRMILAEGANLCAPADWANACRLPTKHVHKQKNSTLSKGDVLVE